MANDFITHQLYAPQVTADPFHKDRLFSKQLKSVYKELHADHETGAADNK